MSMEEQLHELAERVDGMPVARFSERETQKYLVHCRSRRPTLALRKPES